MLVIRKEQMQAFERVRAGDFAERLAGHVRAVWPDCAARYPDADSLRAFVDAAIERARGWGFTEHAHVRTLLDWEAEFGQGFAQRPQWEWLRQILTSDMDPASKIFRVENRIKILRSRGAL